jgi:TPR repeat protein
MKKIKKTSLCRSLVMASPVRSLMVRSLVGLVIALMLCFWTRNEAQAVNEAPNQVIQTTVDQATVDQTAGHQTAVNQTASSRQADDDSSDGAAPNASETQKAPQNLTPQEVMALLEYYAEQKDPESMMTLGLIYERGLNGKTRHFGKALEWYAKAAAEGLASGFYNVGVCYEVGMGTAPDEAKALENFKLASDKGFAQADYRLANIYLQGLLGASPDEEIGLAHLRKAADLGHLDAQKDLGAILYYGHLNQPKDLKKALELFTKVAEAGDAVAMKNIGAMLLNEEGLINQEGAKSDVAQGLKWYLLALEHGYDTDEMRTTIDDIKTSLTPEQIKEAEALAKDWKEKHLGTNDAQNP